jgi:hypothetical protein
MPDTAARQTRLELALAKMGVAPARKTCPNAAVQAAAGPKQFWREPLLPPTTGGVQEVDPAHPAPGAFHSQLLGVDVCQWDPSARLLPPTTTTPLITPACWT